MKLCWNFLNNPDSLWATVLRFKYIKDNSTNISKSRSSSLSPILRGIKNAAAHTRDASSWIIGSGLKVKFWWDSWLDGVGPLINFVEPSTTIPNVDASIADIAPRGN